MAEARLLGIDIGTTGVRAAIFSQAGSLLGEATAPCLYDSPEPGWAEVRPERWWETTKSVLADLATRTEAGSLAEVTALGVVGQAPTAALVDTDGAALGPAILWLDTRAADEARELGVH